MPVIGLLSGTDRDARQLAAIWRGLNEAGYVEGRNAAIEYRQPSALTTPPVEHFLKKILLHYQYDEFTDETHNTGAVKIEVGGHRSVTKVFSRAAQLRALARGHFRGHCDSRPKALLQTAQQCSPIRPTTPTASSS
jgi:hypothetical protein